MMTEFLRPSYLDISCTDDQCAFSGAVMSTKLEVSIEKKDKVFLKIISQDKGSIPYVLSSY